jgi:hypothetical protein
LEEVAPYESGRDKRYFTWVGDMDLMYSKYFIHFEKDPSLIYEKQTFVKIVKHERIGLHSGDVFYDSVKILYNRMTEMKNNGEEVDQDEYDNLEKQFNFNKDRRNWLRGEIQGLEGDDAKYTPC